MEALHQERADPTNTMKNQKEFLPEVLWPENQNIKVL